MARYLLTSTLNKEKLNIRRWRFVFKRYSRGLKVHTIAGHPPLGPNIDLYYTPDNDGMDKTRR